MLPCYILGGEVNVSFCNEIETLFAKQGFSRSGAATLLSEATPCLQSLSHGMEAASGRAMRLRFSAGGALRAQETSLEPFAGHPPSDGE